MRRQIGNTAARELLSRLLQRVTNEVIQAALKSAITDFEAANAADVEIIVTGNISDFGASSVPAMLSEQFGGTS